MSSAPPVVARPALWFGLSPAGFVALVAVLAVLLVVSLPRLRGLARLENEGDARATAELLVRALAPLEECRPGAALEPLATRATLVRALSDGEWLEQGRVLRRHGYLFELCAPPVPLQAAGLTLVLAGASAEPTPRFAVCAWPWNALTGRTVFVASECGTVLTHANQELRWHGLEQRPSAELAADPLDWQRLP